MLKDLIYLTVIITIIDFTYLKSISNAFNNIIYKIQNSKMEIRFLGVLLCYISLVFSLYYFIIKKNGTIFDAFLLGFFIYAVFETTNYALLKKWPFYLTILIYYMLVPCVRARLLCGHHHRFSLQYTCTSNYSAI